MYLVLRPRAQTATRKLIKPSGGSQGDVGDAMMQINTGRDHWLRMLTRRGGKIPECYAKESIERGRGKIWENDRMLLQARGERLGFGFDRKTMTNTTMQMQLMEAR